MATCQSCGGVIGRDCFNPQECQWIADQMDQQSKVDSVRESHHDGYQLGYHEGYQAAMNEVAHKEATRKDAPADNDLPY